MNEAQLYAWFDYFNHENEQWKLIDYLFFIILIIDRL